jgi:hypothetical protein
VLTGFLRGSLDDTDVSGREFGRGPGSHRLIRTLSHSHFVFFWLFPFAVKPRAGFDTGRSRFHPLLSRCREIGCFGVAVISRKLTKVHAAPGGTP